MPKLPPVSQVLSIALLLSACSGDGGTDIQPPPAVTAVTVTAPTTNVETGQTVQLAATAQDAEGDRVEVGAYEWTTTDGAIASVSSTGLVTGLAPGQVEISATTGSVTGSLAIEVVAPPVVPPPPPPGPVTLRLQEVATGLDFT